MNILALILNSQIGRVALVSVAAAIALWWAIDFAQDRREEQVRAAIERHNRERADAAAKSTGPVYDCYDIGGRWLQSEGRCVVSRLPSP